MVRQSQEKNPEIAIPSTMIIMPKMKIIVCQLIPFVLSVASAPARQKSTDVKDWKFSVSNNAVELCIQTPNTRMSVATLQSVVAMCRGIFSVIMNANITRKIMTARDLCCHKKNLLQYKKPLHLLCSKKTDKSNRSQTYFWFFRLQTSRGKSRWHCSYKCSRPTHL